MSKNGFQIKIDDKKLQQQMKKAMAKAPVETKKAMNDVTLHLKGEVQRRAPIESGDLRGSAYVTVTGTSNIVGEVGVTGVYALRQHEDLTLHHDRTDGYVIRSGPNAGRTVNMVAGGESKYIENPLKENLERYTDRFKKVVKDSLR